MREVLKETKENADLIKRVITADVERARTLLDEDTFHELQSSLLEISSDIGVAESSLGEFERIGFGNPRFAVKR